MNDSTSVEKRARVASYFDEARKAFPDVPVMSVAEGRARAAEGSVTLLDVREDGEQEISMIPGAIPRHAFEADQAGYEGRTLVTYCTMGYRSGMYASKLKSRGWDVYALDGSILGWVHEDGALVDANGPTRRVHLFVKKFDLLPAGYEGIL